MINNVFITLGILSLNQVFEFDVGMAVLTLFKCLTTVDADGLLWAHMHASEAHGAVVADMGNRFVCILYSVSGAVCIL